MQKYAKFLKNLLTNKRKWEEVNTMVLNGNCSAIINKIMPIKLRDPRSFIISCLFGDAMEENALADSSASINIIPYIIYMKLGLGELRSTIMTLQLADRSIRRLHGIAEDMLVTMEKLVFPLDFVILDIDEDVETLLIL
ncbi:uncharacterized protein LOC120268593 [Dioscorea cayenensis subsp. rotundata]|uniref:Uncharacterized protein LOC120268593 n=1 Tax=Dioscorea cayennensis subsp. rotundata TaxID=55577 RepID=A0AB40BWM2_DIOCR|nr:uncharacterized protein LOC120268593 [Dioscorea cayenensis subsp. rotundata]